jgi:hypothetical protein
MSVSFLILGKAGHTLSPVYIALIAVAIVVQVLLLMPIPNAIYEKLKHKYMLRVSPNKRVVSDTKRIKYIDEVVYECDTNLPIRLLFILNSIPLLKNLDAGELSEMKFASGRAVDLCDKLIEIDRRE